MRLLIFSLGSICVWSVPMLGTQRITIDLSSCGIGSIVEV
jgi:hypothetical protein